jgi:hypothetical protein
MAREAGSIRSLKSLIRRYPAFHEILFIISDTPEPTAQADRTTVIVGTAWLDIFLELVIYTRLIPGDHLSLFTGNGPLRDMSARIQLLYGLGLITDFIRDELDTIREIRNCFAHTASLITFETEEVENACNRLWIPRVFPPDDPEYIRDAKGQFRLSVRMLWVFLSDQIHRKRPNSGVLLRHSNKRNPELFPPTLPEISQLPRHAAPRSGRRRERKRADRPRSSLE